MIIDAIVESVRDKKTGEFTDRHQRRVGQRVKIFWLKQNEPMLAKYMEDMGTLQTTSVISFDILPNTVIVRTKNTTYTFRTEE